jgi:hypothetical protein
MLNAMTCHVRLLVTLVVGAALASSAPAAQATELRPSAFKTYEQIGSEILIDCAHGDDEHLHLVDVETQDHTVFECTWAGQCWDDWSTRFISLEGVRY